MREKPLISNKLDFKTINNCDQFFDLRGQWDHLLEKSSNKAITQTWQWMYTWWEIYGDERDLCIVVAYDADEIVGIAPLSAPKEETRYFGFLHYKTLWFLPSGRTNDRNVTSDYLNFIIADGYEKDFIDSLLDWMSRSLDWDEIILENLSSESIVPRLLQQATKQFKLNFLIINRAPSILIKLPRSWEDYLKSIPSSLRYKIRRGRKEFLKLKGTYRLLLHGTELPRAFNDLERLHQSRWLSKGQPGAFSSPKWKTFHKKLMPRVFTRGCLRLSFLDLDGRPVAANYNFVSGNNVHFFQSGLIPHKNKHVRLGLLLHSYCIEEAINEGLEEYDFLKVGGLGAGYKDTWGNYARDLLDIRISRPSNIETCYAVMSNILSFLRNLKQRIQ